MNTGIISMNAGKITPLIDARSDIQKYSSGCRILQNMIPRIYGPVERRPGTRYITGVEDNSVNSRMVAFRYSATIAYKLEFANLKINVYFNDDLVASVVSPYLEADLYQLQIRQLADVMWIVHPSYAPRKLSRISVETFSLDTIIFDKGPFKERNDIIEDDDVTITVTGYSTSVTFDSGTKTITFTTTTDLSSLFPVNKRLYVANATASANDGAYTVASTTWTTPTQTVVVNETVSSDTDGGQIMVDGGTVTLTASSPVFVTGSSGHTGSLFKLTHKRLLGVVKGSSAHAATGIISQSIDVKGNFTFTTGGNWDKTVELQRLEDGTNWEVFRSYTSTITNNVGSRNVQKSHVEEADNVQYRIWVLSTTAGTVDADIAVDKSTQDSIFRITATATTVSATAIAIVAAPDIVAAKRWAEGSWSAVRGYPAAITFYDERVVYGFNDEFPQDIWLSETGEYEDFEAGIKDADSFAITLPTANRGRWLASLETLAAGTTGNVWRIRATTLDTALSPTNFEFKIQTEYGSADMQAVEVNEAILFVDFVARKVREFTYSEQKQKYVSPDLTALAEDITKGGITSIAVQNHPDTIIWFTIGASPYLISMTYDREQNVVSWSTHPLGGNGIAESVIVTPGTDEDIITLTVRRTINGSSVRFMEEMQPRDWGSTTDAADSFFVDAGIVDTNGSTTITGLDHLEGEEVAVLVDGAVQARQTVSGGKVTITEKGDRAVVGLPYEYKVSPMRMDFTTGGGTTFGSIELISELAISLFASGNVSYGDGDTIYPINARTTEVYGSPPQLFTGIAPVAFGSGYSLEKNIVISGSDPLPCTVRAIIAKTRKTGR